MRAVPQFGERRSDRTYVDRPAAFGILEQQGKIAELCAERAFILAATDHAEEAAAELETLNPAYPFLARARFRVQLVALARRGDLAGAARLAEQEALDLPINPRDELLADAARVAASPESCGAGEVGRVKEELRTQAPLRRWMEVVAPSLLRAVELAAEGEAAAGEEGEEARSRAAEEEARAEEEGEGARKMGKRALGTRGQ